ncbi:MAG: M24 family metallopeptidase [Bacillota bacterium]
MYHSRLKNLRSAMQEAGLDALLVQVPENRYYLSAFTGSTGALLITDSECFFFTDFRYIEQAAQQCPHCTVVRVQERLTDQLAEHLAGWQGRNIGFEAHHVTFQQHELMQQKVPQVNWRPVTDLVETLRLYKDREEIRLIRESVALADAAFAEILPAIRPGVSERELAWRVEAFLRQQGASGVAFPFIFASGPRGAMPHGVASERVLQEGDLLTMDFGAVVNQYCSDMTRTVAVGYCDDRQREIYQVVLVAQQAAVAAIKPGVKASDVDAAARRVIKEAGFGDYFGHGTGHGVGLAVHEAPRLSWNSEQVLQAGMVVTVEPGIYLPGWGGVRIEDMVLVTENGHEVLTASPKQLLVCA